jgi:hypothetical protein
MVWLLALWVATAVLVGGNPQQCPEKTIMADFNMTEVSRTLRYFDKHFLISEYKLQPDEGLRFPPIYRVIDNKGCTV